MRAGRQASLDAGSRLPSISMSGWFSVTEHATVGRDHLIHVDRELGVELTLQGTDIARSTRG